MTIRSLKAIVLLAVLGASLWIQVPAQAAIRYCSVVAELKHHAEGAWEVFEGKGISYCTEDVYTILTVVSNGTGAETETGGASGVGTIDATTVVNVERRALNRECGTISVQAHWQGTVVGEPAAFKKVCTW